MNEAYQSNTPLEETSEEQRRRERRAKRIQQMKKEKERQLLLQKCILVGIPALIVIIIVALFATHCGKEASMTEPSASVTEESTSTMDALTNDIITETEIFEESQPTSSGTPASSDPALPDTVTDLILPSAAADSATKSLGSELDSNYAIFVDLDSDTILARKNSDTVISPASMTKVLTILVAAEQITREQLDDTFTMTLEITDYSYVNDCSNVGFLDGEVITVRDLFYGTALQSGGDAAVGLATYIAGSHEAFVEMMNEKLEQLGLAETAHVTNCVGLYHQEHHCTVYDMAMIMEAAIANDICREVMGARTYTTSATQQHPEGINISNWFIRRIEDKDTGGQILAAKTGYVVQSGSCAVSYGQDHSGKEYICVTADAGSSWRCIYDHVAIYQMFSSLQE